VSEENQSGHPDPYAPPESELEASLESVLPSARRAGFATHALLVQAITGLLGVQAILHAINAVVCLLLASGMSEVAGAIELVPVSRALAGAQPFFYLMGIIPFALFLYGANKNARQFELAAGASDDAEQGAVWSFSPGSMVWWYAVPFFNLVRPYQAVRAVWASSAPEYGGVEFIRSDILPAWWAAWLLALVASRGSAVLKETRLNVAARDVVIAVVSLLGVASCLLAVRMVRALYARQRQRAAELWP